MQLPYIVETQHHHIEEEEIQHQDIVVVGIQPLYIVAEEMLHPYIEVQIVHPFVEGLNLLRLGMMRMKIKGQPVNF